MTNVTKLQAQVLTFPRTKAGKIQFTNEFRKEACALITEDNMSMADVARTLGISYHNVYTWMNGYTADKYDAKGIAVSRMRPSDPVKAIQAKLDKLETERAKMTTALQLLKELGL